MICVTTQIPRYLTTTTTTVVRYLTTTNPTDVKTASNITEQTKLGSKKMTTYTYINF